MDVKKLLEVRKNTKATKPSFKRQSAGSRQNLGQKVKVGTKYRRPKGYHSKLRLGLKGRLPSCGFRAPALIRGTNADGLKEVIVSSVKALENIDAKTECVVVGSTVGSKKKIEILEKAIEMKLTTDVDAKAVVADLKKKFDEAKAARKAKKASRVKAAPKDTKKKTSTKKEKSEDKSDEKSKDAAKKEQEKVLINKEKAM